MTAERELIQEMTVRATPWQVWRAFTSAEGVTSFMCPAARIEPHVGGAYEIYFSEDAPQGSRGSETCRILEYDEPRQLAFTWNFPPSMPSIRFEHTRVELRFTETPDGGTHVRLRQTEWQNGADWDNGYAYFDQAWAAVLRWLRQYFDGEVPDSKRS